MRRPPRSTLFPNTTLSRSRRTRGRPRGRGGPARRFHLTDAGRSDFPHAYDDLALTALRYVAASGGPDAVRAVAEAQLFRLRPPRFNACGAARPDRPRRPAQGLRGAPAARGLRWAGPG